jgi:tRNA(His) guanylyltransferase
MDLGDRMKNYEKQHQTNITDPFVIIRLDGRGFSKFTRFLNQPYDIEFHTAMTSACKDLLAAYHDCSIAYTQSDEVTLVFPEGLKQFNGRTDKYLSLVASLMSVRFNQHLQDQKKEQLPPTKIGIATFDARIFTVTDINECLNCILWRARTDCVRNSVDKIARQSFSAQQLHKKNTSEKIEMMQAKGIDYINNTPLWVQYGKYLF